MCCFKRKMSAPKRLIDSKTWCPLTLPLPRGGGGGGASQPAKGFSSITFEENKLETSNFA